MEPTLKILETVNQFYTQSFNQLILIIGAIFAFVGVFLPILISLYQKRLFRLEQKEVEASIGNTLKDELKLIEKKIKKEYEEKESELEKKYQY